MQRDRRIGFACAFAVLFVWAGFLVSARLSAAQAFTPWDVGALRHAGAFLAALPLLLVARPPRLAPWRIAALVLPAGFGFPLLTYHAFAFAPAAHGGVLLAGMQPFLTAGLAVLFLGERWTRQRLLSLGVVGLGIALLASDTFGAHPGAWRGDLLLLGASLCWAVYTLLVRQWQVPALPATLAIALFAAPVYLPVWWLLLPSNLGAVAPGAMLYQFVYQGAVAVVIAGFLFTRAVNGIGVAQTTTITALVPGIAALAAWPLLDEPLGAAGLAGIAAVCAGMVLGVVPWGGLAGGREAGKA